MSNVDQGFRDAAATLLREAFEGMPDGQNFTWFVEKKEGIFDALESTSAEAASRKPTSECSSIAAHTYHLLFAMRGANMCQGRPAPEGTWESSWDKQTVTEAEWSDLKAKLRAEYESYLAWFSANEDWTHPDAHLNTLTPLPHVAYHLGAIRQIMKVI